MINISKNIRRLREAKGLSQENIAFDLGISQSTYSKIERDASNITVARLMKIAELLDVDVYDIFDKDRTERKASQNNSLSSNKPTNKDLNLFIEEIKHIYEKTLDAQEKHIAFLQKEMDKKRE